jgi:hypothetical protein
VAILRKRNQYNLNEAYAEYLISASKAAAKDDFVFIGGSTFVVAELALNEGF